MSRKRKFPVENGGFKREFQPELSLSYYYLFSCTKLTQNTTHGADSRVCDAIRVDVTTPQNRQEEEGGGALSSFAENNCVRRETGKPVFFTKKKQTIFHTTFRATRFAENNIAQFLLSL